MNSAARIKVIGGWVALMLVCLFSLTWLQPRLLAEARQERQQLQQRMDRAQDGAAEIRALVSELDELRESTVSLKRVPNESQFAGLIQDLGSQLERLGVEKREITNGGSVDLGPAKSIPMRIRMTSDFLGAFETIEWIESLDRLIRVQRVQLTTTDERAPWSAKVEAEITLDAVFDPSTDDEIGAGFDPEADRS